MFSTIAAWSRLTVRFQFCPALHVEAMWWRALILTLLSSSHAACTSLHRSEPQRVLAYHSGPNFSHASPQPVNADLAKRDYTVLSRFQDTSKGIVADFLLHTKC